MKPPQILSNDDVLLRTMEFLGPRHACVGMGATCRDLRRLSKCDSLWRAFWEARCLLPPELGVAAARRGDDASDEGERRRRNASAVDGEDDDGLAAHKAAFVFRRAIHELDLADMLYASCGRKRVGSRATNEGDPSKSSEESTLLYSAYVQKHTSMKHTNLRVAPFGRPLKNEGLERSALRGPMCTQTWIGQLSLNEGAGGGRNSLRNRVTCLNPAEAWCDHPTCSEARCGPRGCLRCYRFQPRDYGLSASGQLVDRGCSEGNYDFVSFVKCSWCSVSFCNEHLDEYYRQTRGGPGGQSWYHCDECQLSSCPDCVSQVFLSVPDMEGCGVVTAGETCRRTACANCTWCVGRKKQEIVAGNVPGGNYDRGGDSAITTAKGARATRGEAEEWEEVETSCSKCLRHVEFRWRELAEVQEAFGDAFGGFMP